MVRLKTFLYFWSLRTGCLLLSSASMAASIALSAILILILITENLDEYKKNYYILLVVVILGIYLPSNLFLFYGTVKARPLCMVMWLVVALFKMLSLVIDTFIKWLIFKYTNFIVNITLLAYTPFMMFTVYSHLTELMAYYAANSKYTDSNEAEHLDPDKMEPPGDILDIIIM